MLPQPIREAAKCIGEFYLEKNAGDYIAAENELRRLNITKLEIVGEYLHITASYVGLLIGKRCQNIDSLSAFLKEKQMFAGVKIFENTINLYDYLIPRNAKEFADWYYDYPTPFPDEFYEDNH